MKIHNFIFKEEAGIDIIEAFDWYESKLSGLGQRFLESIDICLNYIDRNPKSFRKIYKDQRQAVVNVFPFVILYEENNSEIVVYAVFNTNQDPNLKIR